jgi:hypothetical protein
MASDFEIMIKLSNNPSSFLPRVRSSLNLNFIFFLVRLTKYIWNKQNKLFKTNNAVCLGLKSN